MNSKQKGKRGELEAVKLLRDFGFLNVRRSVQYNGKAEDGQPDIVGVQGVHIEVKRNERLNVNEAMDQAIRDSQDGETPIVLHRKNNKPWLVTMRAEDWARYEKCREGQYKLSKMFLGEEAEK